MTSFTKLFLSKQLPKIIRKGNDSSFPKKICTKNVSMSCSKCVRNYLTKAKNAIFEVGYFPNQNRELTFENDLGQLGLSSSKQCGGTRREKLTVNDLFASKK